MEMRDNENEVWRRGPLHRIIGASRKPWRCVMRRTMDIVDWSDTVSLRKRGIEALRKELGPVGLAAFMRLFEEEAKAESLKPSQDDGPCETIEDLQRLLDKRKKYY
jgi:hypothetical protein